MVSHLWLRQRWGTRVGGCLSFLGFAEAALAVGVVFLGGLVAVFLGAEEARAEAMVDGLGLVVFEDFGGWGNLVSVRGEDDAVDGT